LSTLQQIIERGWERRTELAPARADAELRDAVEQCLAGLDAGTLRVAEPRDGGWAVNQWLKQAVLLSFRINDNRVIDAGYTRFFDKVPQKFNSRSTMQSNSSAAARAWCPTPSCAAARTSRPTSC
jgi:2,3,4,5-tetrahydropyridine-2,6-dicarboxylate N-succinyltransferase